MTKTASIFDVLRRVSGYDLTEELNGQHINRLSNVLTLREEVRTFFGQLLLYFEEIEVNFTSSDCFKLNSLNINNV